MLTCYIRQDETADSFLVLPRVDNGVFPAAGQTRLTSGPARTVPQLGSIPQPLDGRGGDGADTAGQTGIGA